MLKRGQPPSDGGNVQKSPSSKAAAIFTSGAYMKYVSATAAKSGKSVRPKVGKMTTVSVRSQRTPLAAFFNIPLRVGRGPLRDTRRLVF